MKQQEVCNDALCRSRYVHPVLLLAGMSCTVMLKMLCDKNAGPPTAETLTCTSSPDTGAFVYAQAKSCKSVQVLQSSGRQA